MAINVIGGTLGADAAVIELDCGAESSFVATVSGAMSGTITFQVLYDAAEGWISASCTTRAGVVATATLTAAGSRIINAPGALGIRARMSPYVSGTPTVTLASVDGTAMNAGGGGGGGGAVTVANGADEAQGSTTDTGIITDVNGTVIGFLRGAIKMWLNFLARFPAALGSTTAAASLPVTLSTDGQFVTSTGSLTEAVPATDTASSGLNGRLQRIAQRLTTLIAQLPAALINGALAITGDVASGVNDAGNPVKQGFLSISHGSSPTAVATAQRVNALASRVGVQFVAPGHPNTITHTLDFVGAQTNAVVVANSAGTKLVVTSYLVYASGANTVTTPISVGLAQTVTPPSGTVGRLGAGTVPPGGGFGRKCYQAGADGDQILATSTGAGNFSVQVEYHTTVS